MNSRVIPDALSVPADSQPLAAAPVSAPRQFYWSVRRELWENRAVYLAPLATAAVILFAFAITAGRLPARWRAVQLLAPTEQRAQMALQYNFTFNLIFATGALVWVFYCLDTLYGERRDRSILFWKSLPVSDTTTVLSKASVPLVVLPLFTYAITVATELIVWLIYRVVMLLNGLAPALSNQIPPFQSWPVMLYAVVVMTLWQAPIFAWLLLVSAWARRAAFLWALVPLLAIGAVEKIAFQTTHFFAFLRYSVSGWATEGFAGKLLLYFRVDPLNPATPGRFFATPHLLLGLAFTALCLVAAIRLRRYRGPV